MWCVCVGTEPDLTIRLQVCLSGPTHFLPVSTLPLAAKFALGGGFSYKIGNGPNRILADANDVSLSDEHLIATMNNVDTRI